MRVVRYLKNDLMAESFRARADAPRPEVEDIVRRHASQKFDIDVPDGDRLQIGVDRHFAAHEHKEPQEHPQVQMIFVDGLGRLALDGLVVRQKLPQDLRSIRIDHNNTSKQAP